MVDRFAERMHSSADFADDPASGSGTGDDAHLALIDALLAAARERLLLDPPPLDRSLSEAELFAQTGATITSGGLGGERALSLFTDVLAPACLSMDHPRYLAFVPNASTEAATAFDALLGASNIYGGSWLEGSGAVHAEAMVRWGARDGVCVDTFTLTSSYPPCAVGQVPLTQALSDNQLYNRIIGAWSMRGFTPGVESGHDHFFATFDRFGAAFGARKGDGLAEVAQRAALQNEQYIEPLITPQFGKVSTLAKAVGYDSAGTVPGGEHVRVMQCRYTWCEIRAAEAHGWTNIAHISFGTSPWRFPDTAVRSPVRIGGPVCFYSGYSYSGSEVCFNGGHVSRDLRLAGLDNSFRSVKVGNGSALVCRDRNFRSYCVVVNKDTTHLEGLLDGAITSIHVY